MAMKSASSLKSYDYYQSLLGNPNVQAALNTIAYAEGLSKVEDPYSTLVGYGTFQDQSKHPGIAVQTGYGKSTAAGKYQALKGTWNEVAKAVGIPDFTPTSQDVFAVARLDQRNALDDVLAGDVKGWTDKARNEWASLPTSELGQGRRTQSQIEKAYNAYLQAAKNTPAFMNGFRQAPVSVKTIDGVRSLSKSLDQAKIPTPLSREFSRFNNPRNVPVPQTAPSRVPPGAVQFGPGPSSRTPPAAPQPARSVPESAVRFGPGPASRTAPSGPASVANMLSGPAAIREREERGVYSALRGAALNQQNMNTRATAGVMAAAGSPTINPPEGARQSQNVTSSKTESNIREISQAVTDYMANPSPANLEAARQAIDGSKYTNIEKQAALDDVISGTEAYTRGIMDDSKYAEAVAYRDSLQRAFFDVLGQTKTGTSLFSADKKAAGLPDTSAQLPAGPMSSLGRSLFPGAFAAPPAPDMRASGWGLMAQPATKGPALPSDPRLNMAVGSLPKGPTFAAPAPAVNPAEIARMRDNLTSRMAFALPNPSNMNISGYGFATPARASGPSATGSATGSINRASATGNVAVPARTGGVLGGRGNINPPNVVAAPANVLSNFDQYGNFTGNRQSSAAPTSDFRSALAERAAVPQRSTPNATAFGPGPTSSKSVQQAQADLAKSNARDQFARDIIKGMPVEAPRTAPQRGPTVSTWGSMAAATPISSPSRSTQLDAIDIPGSARPADQSQRFAPMPNNRPQVAPVAPAQMQAVPQTVGPRSPTVAPSLASPQAITDAAKSRFDVAKPGIFQGIPPSDIYDENAPGRSGFRGFGAGGFLGNLLTGNLISSAGIEGGLRLPGVLGLARGLLGAIGNGVPALSGPVPQVSNPVGYNAAMQAAKQGANMNIGRDASGRIGWGSDGALSSGALGAGWASNNPERSYGGYGSGYDPSPT